MIANLSAERPSVRLPPHSVRGLSVFSEPEHGSFRHKRAHGVGNLFSFNDLRKAVGQALQAGELRRDGKTCLVFQRVDAGVSLSLIHISEHKVSQAELMREVWGAESEMEKRALWTLVSRLRKKLHSEDSRLEISSLRGGGYLLEQL